MVQQYEFIRSLSLIKLIKTVFGSNSSELKSPENEPVKKHIITRI